MIERSDLPAMQARIADIAAGTGAFRHSAREILALTAFRTGAFAEAIGEIEALLADPALPADMRQRAETLQAVLAGRNPAADGQGTSQ